MLPVQDSSGRYVGVITARAVAEAVIDADDVGRPVSDVAELPEPVYEDQCIAEAVSALDRSGYTAMPVVSRESCTVLGWMNYQAALRPNATAVSARSVILESDTQPNWSRSG